MCKAVGTGGRGSALLPLQVRRLGPGDGRLKVQGQGVAQLGPGVPLPGWQRQQPLRVPRLTGRGSAGLGPTYVASLSSVTSL